jgi:hypothetical protein
MANFSKDALPPKDTFKTYRKTTLTKIAGPFPAPVTVTTREGKLVSTTEAAYVAIDSGGWPYPIAASEFEAIYEEADA